MSTQHGYRLAEAARTEIGAISRQAVYDALGVLAEHGLIRRVQPAGSAALYDPRTGDNHHHVICRHCGAVADVDCAIGDAPCLTASHDSGYAIDEAEVTYWGTCPTCRASRITTESDLANASSSEGPDRTRPSSSGPD